MASGRKSEDYNWDFAEEVDDGSPKPIQDVEEVYKQVMKDGTIPTVLWRSLWVLVQR